jgi:hypothetical protein
VNKHATIRKDANIPSRHWVFSFLIFGFLTNNPIRVNPLTAESVTIAVIKGTNGKIFKVRSLMGCFCDISEIFFGKIGTMRLIIPMFKCKNSE